MVFKGRFFCSQKQSKAEGSDNQNHSEISRAPIRSNGIGTGPVGTSKTAKKKGSGSREEIKRESNGSVVFGNSQIKDVRTKTKEISGKEASSKTKEAETIHHIDGVHKKDTSTKMKKASAIDEIKEKSPGPSAKEVVGDRAGNDRSSSSGSPILASSLGLNRIKTRSGPLPQESFLSGKGLVNNLDHVRRLVPNGQDGVPAKSSTLGASKLSRTGTGSTSTGTTAYSTSQTEQKSVKKMSSSHSIPLGSGSALSNDDIGSRGVISRKEPSSGRTSHDNMSCSSWVDIDSNFDCMSTGGQSRDESPIAHGTFRLHGGNRLQTGLATEKKSSPWGAPECSRSADTHAEETETPCGISDTPKESESPRFQALLRVTGGPRKKKLPNDIKSFSHELDPRGVRLFPFWKPRSFDNLEEVLRTIRARFDRAKEEVDSDLAIFAGDLVEILEKNAEVHPEWQESLEDLLVLARQCAMMSPGEFWLQCEGIVQDLDDRRQELPMGVLKQLHTRMLFILTRCTRLLQFHKEHGLDEDGHVLRFDEQNKGAAYLEKRAYPTTNKKGNTLLTIGKDGKPSSTLRFFSQEQKIINWKGREKAIHPLNMPNQPSVADDTNCTHFSGTRDRLASWKKLPCAGDRTHKRSMDVKESASENKCGSMKMLDRRQTCSDGNLARSKTPELPVIRDSSAPSSMPPKHQHRISWGYWGDQQNFSDENYVMICRICEEEVPTSHLEEHSRICTVADRCELNGLSVNERLRKISETLERMVGLYAPKSSLNTAMCSPDAGNGSNMSITEGSDVPSPRLSDWSRRGSEDMLDCLPEMDAIGGDELKGLTSMACKTRFGSKSEQGMATSSVGSMTPRSPLATPRTCQIDLLLADRNNFCENDDLPQINELADIACCVANTNGNDEGALEHLISCLQDLQQVLQNNRTEALTVDTFGRRIEKLLREKYLQVCELIETQKLDMSSGVINEDGAVEDDVIRSLQSTPVHPACKDRTSIDDFEIIKPISRGAFGRVLLARKRTTGDLFAIKVLRKADMIRKNAVDNILAERDILISVRNPFVVRFFYSFTCRENLYLVMEYLNGGDLYSLLRTLGYLDENMARVYIAEVVLALEYLHSLGVVHRDLKPDNLLIAHDGHIKLTDFGLSKVGLINSTDDLSGPAVSDMMLLGEEEHRLFNAGRSSQRESRKKRSAVGTPDYLAPEILLGTGHGYTADWWSVGVIVFELLTGIPPFNAEHPQIIFDNILNRKILWHHVPEEMTYEAKDLIQKLLVEDPCQRLGAKGAIEVKSHQFFKDINWDTLARQKAAFIPNPDCADDTSYFTSRHMWTPSEDHIYASIDFEDLSDGGSSNESCSSLSSKPDEMIDECGDLAEFESAAVKYSFSNFSFKNLSQLASINHDLLIKTGKDSPRSSESQFSNT